MSGAIIFLVIVLFVPVTWLLTLFVERLVERGLPKVVFVCEHNAGRSQISQAYFAQRYGRYASVLSAGTNPAARAHPEVVAVLKEQGLGDKISQPRQLEPEMIQGAIGVLECEDETARGMIMKHASVLVDLSSLEDPVGKGPSEVKHIFETIVTRIEQELVPCIWGQNGDRPESCLIIQRGSETASPEVS